MKILKAIILLALFTITTLSGMSQDKSKKSDPDKIRTAISKIGYDADDVPADPVACEKLPKCCRKDVAPH